MRAARMTTRVPAIGPSLTSRPDLAFILGGVAAAMAIGTLVSKPEMHRFAVPIIATALLLTMLCLSANAFLVTSFLFFAVLQLVAGRSFSIGPANVFPPDLFVLLVTIRAILPRIRANPSRRLHALTLGAFGAWSALMALGILRGLFHGTAVDVTVRTGLALFYWPLLYFGFSRVLRERGVDYSRVVRAIVAIGLGLTAYMFLMRFLNRPFESTNQVTGHLGEVVSSTGQVFHRDFGFWSAYIVYPIVALIAVGQLVYSRKRVFAWLVIAFVSITATATTLIRSEIYGLIAGIAVTLLFSRKEIDARGRLGSRRLAAVLMLGSLLAVAAALFAVVNPAFARAIGERSIPHYGQESSTARENAEYRLQALKAGASVAKENPMGLGFVSSTELQRRGIDPGFLAHSGPATLLIFVGWPGLIAAAVVLFGLAVDSARARVPGSWLHPVLLGVLVMLVGNSFGAVGIIGQEFVIGIAAFFIALRFAAADAEASL